MEIDPTAAAFEHAAADYERARPGYPREAVAWLADRLELTPSTTVVDLAAGTGKLTRSLVGTGARVIAVEPVDAMRGRLPEHAPGARVLAGTAEAIPLPDGAADAVVVAQAFHWFDGERALAEIHRVLRPHGRLALVWNRRDLSDPVQAAFERIVGPHRGATVSLAHDTWREAFAPDAPFKALEEHRLRITQIVDADGLVARVLSISFIAALGPEQRTAVVQETRALADTLPAAIALPHTTELYLYARR